MRPTAREKKLEQAIKDFLDGNYAHPRSYRPNNCPHGRYYYDDCNQCDAAHFEAALKNEKSPP